MTIFLILGITILILITIVIVQSSKNKEKSTNKPPTTQPPTTQPPITKPPTTDPPVCTKYKYNSSCLDNCGDKFVDETEKKCYDDCSESNNKYTFNKLCIPNCDAYNYIDGNTCYNDIPTDKYADGKTLLSSCSQSQNNKIINGKMCVGSCDEFLHDYNPFGEIEGECKTTCDSYYILNYKLVNKNIFTKLCLKASELSSLFEVDNVKITDDFSKFIIDSLVNPPNLRVFYQGNNQKELRNSVVNSPGFIDLKMSSSGTVYARVYKNKIEILIQDLFNQPSTLPKYTINVPDDFLPANSTSNPPSNSPLNPALGYEIEEFNFCGQDGVRNTLSQAIITLKSTVPNEQGKLKKIMYILVINNDDSNIPKDPDPANPFKGYELFTFQTDINLFPSGEYNETNGEMFKIHNPVYLGTLFQNISLRQDLFGICYSFTNPGGLESYLYYRQFFINYYSPYRTKNQSIADLNLGAFPIYDSQYNGTYQYINAKPTKNTITALRSYTDNSMKLDIIRLFYNDQLIPTVQNVVSNIAVGSTIIDTLTQESKEIVYYITREYNSVLKLNKYKLGSPSEVAYEFPVSSSNAYAYLTSNSDGSILAIGIHDGNTKNLYKYNEVSNTVEQLI